MQEDYDHFLNSIGYAFEQLAQKFSETLENVWPAVNELYGKLTAYAIERGFEDFDDLVAALDHIDQSSPEFLAWHVSGGDKAALLAIADQTEMDRRNVIDDGEE